MTDDALFSAEEQVTDDALRIQAIAPDLLDAVRASGTDVSGRPVESLVAEGGEPLRCCLRLASAGERTMLFGYEPPLPASPYREIGAVYTHAERCAGPASTDVYPPEFRGRAQVLRAYDHRGRIHDATRVHDGEDPEAVLAEMFAHPDVAEIHSRNVAWGCYMFTVLRG